MTPRLTPSFVVAVLALVLAAGGVGYAAGQITSADIKDRTIQARDLKDGAVTPKKIAKCTSGQVKAFGGCVTKKSFGPTAFQAAIDGCTQRGGRLPSLAELRWIGAHSTQYDWANGMPTQYEFSGDYTTDATPNATALDQGGAYFADASASNFWYHCVIG